MPTSPTPITALPTAPSRADPANFATRADSFLGALSTFRSEANALATNAYNNAVEADADATAAASSASAASSSASTATTKASEASASATAAQTSANTAAALLDAFDDRYLGSKASDPTVDNDGNPLLAGALYWSTTASLMKVYDGSAWGMAYVPSDFYLPRSGGTMTGPLTLSGGTANGVLYLNGSKVATSGSALTFDGTNLAVGVSSPGAPIGVQANASALGLRVIGRSTGDLGYINFRNNANSSDLVTLGGQPAGFSVDIAGTEGMRLTSTGLGIGESSPGAKLDVYGGSSSIRTNGATASQITYSVAGTETAIAYVDATQHILGSSTAIPVLFRTGGTEKMRLTSGGDLLVGTTTANAKVKLALTSPGTLGTVVNVGSFGSSGVLSLGGATNNTDGVYLGTGDTGGTGVASGIGFLRGATGWNSALAFYTNNVTSGPNGVSAITERVRITSDGDLGVGTTSPIALGAGYTSVTVNGSTSGRFDVLFNGTHYGAFLADSGGAKVLAQGASNPLVLGTNNTERARITSGGQALFGATTENLSRWGRALFSYPCGTSNPVIGIQNNTARAANNLYGIIFADNTEESNAAVYVRQTGTNNAADLLFGTNAGTGGAGFGAVTERARITSGGDLLVGTTSNAAITGFSGSATGQAIQGSIPVLALVDSDDTTNYVTWLANSGGTTYLYSKHSSSPLIFGTANTERARITSGGDLLVGTTSPYSTAKMTVESTANIGIVSKQGTVGGYCFLSYALNNGGTYYHASFEEAGTQRGSITSNGSATAYNTSSDYRLKDNPQPLTGSGAFIDALKPKTWNWKTDGKRGVGFIAHEAQVVSPSSVVGEKDAIDEDGKPVMQAMEYGSAEFIANIIAELQSLRARVAALESN